MFLYLLHHGFSEEHSLQWYKSIRNYILLYLNHLNLEKWHYFTILIQISICHQLEHLKQHFLILSYSVFYIAHDIMTYLWQLYPRFGPCIFWVCSCQFETGAVWKPLSFCSGQSCTPLAHPPTDSNPRLEMEQHRHLSHHLQTHHDIPIQFTDKCFLNINKKL